MPQTQYNLHLKGFVGGADFDRNYVDYVLAKNAGKDVNVLIDSLGGNLATALSIAAAFKNHGKVSVHFVGMNASAATIASLGAAHISIDKNAMYLVHKCSTAFFEWGSLNADQFRTLIADCEKAFSYSKYFIRIIFFKNFLQSYEIIANFATESLECPCL